VVFVARAHQPTLWVDLRFDGLHQPTLSTQSDECASLALLQSIKHGQISGASVDFVRNEEHRWLEAVKEAGLPQESISGFGRSVPKFPRSVVESLLSIRNTTQKQHAYNFMGRLRGDFDYGFLELRRRTWVVSFVLHNFSDHDFLDITDGADFFQEPLGVYDRSFDPPSAAQVSLYDFPFYTILAASNFTLCPGGDSAWSMRGYEVALMGSICVISDPKEDWDPTTSTVYSDIGKVHMRRLMNMYRYLRLDEPHIYHQDWVDENLRVFIKYQTFIEGDNVPDAPVGSD
jgi:hypothetical protein